MNRPFLMLVVVALAAAFAAVVWFVDPFLLTALGVWLLGWIGLPASLFAIVLLRIAIRGGGSLRPALTILSSVAVFCCLLGVAVPANKFVHECAVATAKEYPARVAALLEGYRQAHGAYPTSLDQLPARPPVPRLLRGEHGYHSDGRSYSFSFGQPGGFIDTWEYDSGTQIWQLSDRGAD